MIRPDDAWERMVIASYVEGLLDTVDLAALGLLTFAQAVDICSDRDVIAADIRQQENET